MPRLDRSRERIQRIMRRAPRSKPIREAEKVRLVDRVQHLDQRPLKDLVLQHSDAERPLPPVGLRDERPPRRLRPVTPAMDPSMQIPKVHLEIQPIVRPRHAINAGSGLRPKREVRRPQAIDIDVVQERREPRILALPRHSAHTIQVTEHAHPGSESGTRFPGRVPLDRPLSSTTSAAPPRALFGSFVGTTGPSDFPRSSITGLRPRPSPHDPPNHHHKRVTVGPPGSRA
jgi:hypothetical protein